MKGGNIFLCYTHASQNIHCPMKGPKATEHQEHRLDTLKPWTKENITSWSHISLTKFVTVIERQIVQKNKCTVCLNFYFYGLFYYFLFFFGKKCEQFLQNYDLSFHYENSIISHHCAFPMFLTIKSLLFILTTWRIVFNIMPYICLLYVT